MSKGCEGVLYSFGKTLFFPRPQVFMLRLHNGAILLSAPYLIEEVRTHTHTHARTQDSCINHVRTLERLLEAQPIKTITLPQNNNANGL